MLNLMKRVLKLKVYKTMSYKFYNLHVFRLTEQICSVNRNNLSNEINCLITSVLLV